MKKSVAIILCAITIITALYNPKKTEAFDLTILQNAALTVLSAAGFVASSAQEAYYVSLDYIEKNPNFSDYVVDNVVKFSAPLIAMTADYITTMKNNGKQIAVPNTSGYQVWTGYPNTPSLTTDRPYQMIFKDNTDGTIYLATWQNRLYLYPGTTAVVCQGNSVIQYKLINNAWQIYISGNYNSGDGRYYTILQVNTGIYTDSTLTTLWTGKNTTDTTEMTANGLPDVINTQFPEDSLLSVDANKKVDDYVNKTANQILPSTSVVTPGAITVDITDVPIKVNYSNDILGSLQYIADTIKYYFNLPINCFKGILSYVGNVLTSITNSFAPFVLFLKGLFNCLPSAPVDMIIGLIGTIVLFTVMRIARR